MDLPVPDPHLIDAARLNAMSKSGATLMYQEAPFPEDLWLLVDDISYKPGWSFWLAGVNRGQGSAGLTLEIRIKCQDSYHPEDRITVVHYFPVPPAAYNERAWRRWLFDQILLVEQHEAMEFFRIKGQVAYPPAHGPGNDPYMILEYGSDADRETSFRGELNLPAEPAART